MIWFSKTFFIFKIARNCFSRNRQNGYNWSNKGVAYYPDTIASVNGALDIGVLHVKPIIYHQGLAERVQPSSDTDPDVKSRYNDICRSTDGSSEEPDYRTTGGSLPRRLLRHQLWRHQQWRSSLRRDWDTSRHSVDICFLSLSACVWVCVPIQVIVDIHQYFF